jgi:hypothetical protein
MSTSAFALYLEDARLERELEAARARMLFGANLKKKSTAVSIIEIELKQLWMKCNQQLCKIKRKACRLSSGICKELKLKEMIDNVQ